MKILVMNGINLCMTGIRDKGVYGTASLEDINEGLLKWAAAAHPEAELTFLTTNFEGEMAEELHRARTEYDGIVMNAGA